MSVSSTATTSAPCAAGTAVVFNRVDGGGHTWPGAPALMDAAGATTNVIDASVASWQFFDFENAETFVQRLVRDGLLQTQVVGRACWPTWQLPQVVCLSVVVK